MADDANLNSSSSDINPCPICLAQITQDSYLDQCFHKFCYNCIVRWTDVVSSKQSCIPSSVKCPLCKTDNFSIIYGYDGTYFQRRYVGKSSVNSEFFTEAHRYRLKCYYTDPGDLSDKLHVARFWKFRKYLQQNRFLPDWLRREIQAVMQSSFFQLRWAIDTDLIILPNVNLIFGIGSPEEEDVDIIMHHILGVIDSLRRKWLEDSRSSSETHREEFKASITEATRPFLTGRTERFATELELFLASGLNIDAFDKAYAQHLGWKIPQISENEYDEPLNHNNTPTVPYLYIFEEDADEN